MKEILENQTTKIKTEVGEDDFTKWSDGDDSVFIQKL